MSSQRNRSHSFSLIALLIFAVSASADPPSVSDVTVEVFEGRITPIHVGAAIRVETASDVEAASDRKKTITFLVKTLPRAGIVSKEIKVPDAPNMAQFLYTSVTPGANTDSFTYVATNEAGEESDAATVSIRIIEAGLRWDLFAAGATSVSDTVNAFNNANFLFRLDWLIKEPWRTVGDKGTEQRLLDGLHDMMPDLGHTSPAASTGERGNRLNRGLNARFTFETGVIAVPVLDEPAGTIEGTDEENEEENTEEPESVQATRNAFTFGGEFIASLVGGAGNGRSLYEIGLGGRASYNVPIRTDQLVEKNGVTFINLAEENRDPGFGLYEVFGKFRLTQFEDDYNKAYDVRKLREKGVLHLVHPKNLEDLIVLEAGFQHNDELRMTDSADDELPLNRWFFRFSATPEIPNARHTRMLLGVEVNNARDDGLRNVRVFYGLNVALDRLFRGI